MKTKFLVPALIGAFLSTSLFSCGEQLYGGTNKTIVKRTLNLVDMSDEYNIRSNKLTTYFYEHGNVPMIGINEATKALKGYLKPNIYTSSTNKIKGTLTFNILGYKHYYFEINYKTDKIKTNYVYFFQLLNDPEGITYGGRTKAVDHEATNPRVVTYDLKKYGYDLFEYNGDVIIPLSLFNSVFITPNLASITYNGEELFFFSTYISESESYFETRNKEVEGKNLPKDLIDDRNRELYFTFDYFYGLKDFKKIDNFKDFISNRDGLLSLLEDTNPNSIDEFYQKFIIETLDDPHTNPLYKSYYHEVETPDDLRIKRGNPGRRVSNLNQVYYNLNDLYYNTFEDYRVIRVYDNVGYIKFNEFNVGRNSDLYDANGNLKPDAWKYDTYYLVKKALDIFREREVVDKVVFDISTNGGGVISSVIDLLGMMSNRNVKFETVNTLDKQKTYVTYEVDADEDGNFKDDDAYDEFKYFILTSGATFSAANYFAANAKIKGLATIIGQKSGGGMCGVSPKTFIDGSSIGMSGTYAMRVTDLYGRDFEIENGIIPNYEIPYERFFDLKYLSRFINKIN